MVQGYDLGKQVFDKPCDWCGEHEQEIRSIYYLGNSPIEINERQAVCRDCATERIPETWAGCQCGEPLDGVNFSARG